jgi:alcohol dehydrogenase (cytochrome c)
MSTALRLSAGLLVLLPLALSGQGRGIDPADLRRPLGASWPTYSGDYTGQRYSSLRSINRDTVRRLTLAWVSALTPGPASGGSRGPAIVSGVGTMDFPAGSASVKGTPLMVDDTLYVSTPDNAWAIDAHDGRPIWHYYWKTRGGTHIANRGLGMWRDFLYMETPDNYLVSLEAKTGRERWHTDFALGSVFSRIEALHQVRSRVRLRGFFFLDHPFLELLDSETGEPH